jgi:hypothetical protein
MDNANLSKLIIQSSKVAYDLKPVFNENSTSYQLSVPSSVDHVEVIATTCDKCASYIIRHPKISNNNTCSLSDGLNKIVVEVASEDGTIKKYEIECIKLSQRDAFLKSISLNNANLIPSFDRNCLSYQASVGFECSKIHIEVEKEDPNMNLSVANQTDLSLNYGYTQFNVCCRSPDGSNSQVI